MTKNSWNWLKFREIDKNFVKSTMRFTHLLLLVLLFLELLLWLFLWHSWQPTITVEGSLLIKSVDKLDDRLGLVLDEVNVGRIWCSPSVSGEHWGQDSKCCPAARGCANTEWEVISLVEAEEPAPEMIGAIAELARLLLDRLRRVEAIATATSINFSLQIIGRSPYCSNLPVNKNWATVNNYVKSFWHKFLDVGNEFRVSKIVY